MPRTSRASWAPAERRHLTVVFCDLVGSTALSERLDPEDLRDVMRAYHFTCQEVVGRFGGHVAQYLGDGVLIYFGYPKAQEDAAHRAVAAALQIAEAIGALPLSLGSIRAPLQARIGIHTGLVVVGSLDEGGVAGSLAIGEAPNVAARLQQLAGPSQVVVSEATYRLVREYFAFESLGPRRLKGVTDPVGSYRALHESGVETRFDVAVREGLIPLVGRQEDLERLVDRWQTVKAGKGQLVLLTGEAGVGKSRLLRALRERLEDEPKLAVECRCSPDHSNSALYPLIAYIERLSGFRREDSPQTKLEKLAGTLAEYRDLAPNAAALFASLLSLPHPAGAEPLALAPQVKKQRTQEALLGWLFEAARRWPVYLEVEDVHWADPSTLELLDLLIAQSDSAPVYLLLTSRRGAVLSRWDSQPHALRVNLGRLGRGEVAQLIGQVAGQKPLPTNLVWQIAAKSDGIPLFVEELTKMVLESGGGTRAETGAEEGAQPPELTIPTTLRDSLMVRLDRVPSARGVAQLGATLGREFSLDLIRAVCPLDEAGLQQSLDILVEAELLRREQTASDVRFSFKHALVQEAAYESLLRSQRQQFHQWIAQVLEEGFPQIAETQPEIVAHHFAISGALERSLPYWVHAGRRALERSAYVEAVNHFTKALEVSATLPESDLRSGQEIDLRSLLGVALVATQGYAAQAVERNYSRSEELCRRLGDAPHLFSTLYGLWTYQMLRDRRDQTLDLAARLQQLAGTPERQFISASVQGVTLYWSGSYEDSNAQLVRAIAGYQPGYHELLAHSLGDDAPLLAHLYHVWTLVELGRFEEARAALAAVPVPAAGPSPYVEATALAFEMVACLNMEQIEATRSLADRLIAHSQEYHLPFFVAAGTCGLGATLVWQGAPGAGLAKIREGLSIFQLTGTATSRAYWLARIAEGLLAEGNAAEGLAIVDDAREATRAGLGRYNLVDLERLRGDLLLLRGDDPAEVERCFRAALAIAASQSAWRQGLLAATRLGRLLARRGRPAEARELVGGAVAHFSERLDAPAPVQARQLLGELS